MKRAERLLSFFKREGIALFFLTLAFLGGGGPPCGGFSTPEAIALDDITTSRQNAIVLAIKRIEPSVVSVGAITRLIVRQIDPYYEDFFDLFFRDFLPPYMYREERIPVMGSGFIFDEKGYIMTNEHVIHGSQEIRVTLADGKQVEANLAGSDVESDIAVLKIEADGELPFAPLGDSDDLLIGEWAIAIGNPLGHFIADAQPTVTVGVISATRRSFTFGQEGQPRVYQEMIQTDAAINPGNSGGPLVNSQGLVIGVNSFIVSPVGASVGLGFAIPINRAKQVAEDIMAHRTMREVWLGFQIIPLSPGLAQALGISFRPGAVVRNVVLKSPADDAGLRPGDVLLKVGDEEVKNFQHAHRLLSQAKVGEPLNLVVWRDGRLLSLALTPRERPALR